MQKGTTYNFYKDLPPWAKGVSVVIVLGIGVVTYFSVRKWLKNRPPKVNYPNNGQGIPVGFDAVQYAEKAHKGMSGLTVWAGDILKRDTAIGEILKLQTDDMFVAVYDTFNKMYMKDGDGTLKEWIDAEYFLPVTNIKEQILARFNRLGLK